MVTFVQKINDDTVNIKVVYTDISRMVSATSGFDVVNINDIISEIKNDDSIKNVNICLNYFEDESKLVDFLNKHKIQQGNNFDSDKITSNNKKQECNKNTQKNNKDYTCPECGGEDCALVDVHGNKYPCLSCLQIDIGQKIMGNIKPVIEKNNMLIDSLCSIFKEKGNQ